MEALTVNAIYENVMYSKQFRKIKTKITGLVVLVILVGFAAIILDFIARYAHEKSVKVALTS